MEKFKTLRGVAAPLPDPGIDTDVIFPARHLLLLDKAGLAQRLFGDRRFDRDGAARPDFVLNRAPYDQAKLIVAGESFGTGSSREQAVWALADFGIRCVMAPSFGEIFFANCFKNGVLPIRLDAETHAAAMNAAQATRIFTVDLEAQRVSWETGAAGFDVEPFRKKCLLEGLDEIGLILNEDADDIAAFEARRATDTPWLVLPDRTLQQA